jgi:hypothetical protein
MGLTKPRAAQIFNLDYKQSTRVVTTTNIALTGSAPNSVDGVTLSLKDRVLVTGQSTASQNGLYLVTTLGSGSNGTWARTTDGDQTGEIEAGMIVMVTEGVIYADTQWKLITDDPIVINTTALTFTQNYMANSISSGSSNVTVYSNSTVNISSAGTANVLVIDSNTVTATANINPAANVTYTLGNTTNRWKDIWLANSSIYLGNVILAATDTSLTVDGNPVITSGGTLSTSGNITGGNLLTDGLVSATGNITGNYILGNGSQLTGLPATYGNANVASFLSSYGSNTISSTGTITAGNITGGNVLTGGIVSATGNVTGNYILGNGASLTGVITSVANINNGTSNVTVVSSGGNVTVGVGGTSNVAVFDTTGLFVTGNITSGNVSATNITGTLTTASQTNITAIGTLGSLSVSGNITGGNLLTSGLVSATGNITGGNLLINGSAVITGNLSVSGTETIFNVANLTVNDKDIIVANNVTGGANIDGAGIQAGNPATATWFFNNATTSWQSNIAITPTANGTLSLGGVSNYWGSAFVTSASITGNVTSGNLTTAGVVSATGNVSGNYFIGNGSQLTGIAASGGITWTTVANTAPAGANPGDFWYNSFNNVKYQYINDGDSSQWVDQSYPTSFSTLAVTGNITSGNLSVAAGNIIAGNLLLSGAIEDSAQLDIRTTANNGNIVLTPNGTGVIVVAKNIVNGQANGVGNIGSSTSVFNTIFAKATSAQYADLAEYYLSDAEYAPGTVVEFGGEFEITQSTQSHSTTVAGVISTNPSYLMNSGLQGKHVLAVALTGRVPCWVTGVVNKGDRLVTSKINGVATVLNNQLYEPGCIIGKALEDYNSDTVGIIEIAVGRY